MAERVTMKEKAATRLWETVRYSKTVRALAGFAMGSLMLGVGAYIAHESSEPIKPAGAVDCGDIDVCDPEDPDVTSPAKADTTSSSTTSEPTPSSSTTSEPGTPTTSKPFDTPNNTPTSHPENAGANT